MYSPINHAPKFSAAGLHKRGAGRIAGCGFGCGSSKTGANNASTHASGRAVAVNDTPPRALPLHLRPSDHLGNLHRLQDLLTDFLQAQCISH